ncbi:hypothetical protein [Rothia nasimurium]|uniref:hypothetical protein n=1 Tax=Rothia nasimurium TaxID=85336 RepID=UPI001F421E05|nr:hypothetical protein [Rothia nasimurium]
MRASRISGFCRTTKRQPWAPTELGGEASGFEDVGDVVVAYFLLGVEELDGAAALGGVEDELLDVLVLHRWTFHCGAGWCLHVNKKGRGVIPGKSKAKKYRYSGLMVA